MGLGESEFKRRISKITPKNKEYRDQLDQRADWVENKVFASEVPLLYNAWRKLIASETGKEQADRREEESARDVFQAEAAKSFEKFRGFLNSTDGNIRGRAEFFLRNAVWQSADIAKWLLQAPTPPRRPQREELLEETEEVEEDNSEAGIQRLLQHLLSPNKFKRLAEEGQVPLEIWAEVIQANEKSIETHQKNFEEKFLPDFKAEVQAKMPAFLTKYGLESHTPEIMARIESISVRVVDVLTAGLEKMGGKFIAEENLILLSDMLNQKGAEANLKKVYIHEIFHALSGRLVYRERVTTELEEEGEARKLFVDDEYKEARVGLMFGTNLLPLDVDLHVRPRFRWMNEAITDMLTLEFLGENEDSSLGSYNDEKVIVRYLCENGKEKIPRGLFVRAFFEDYDPRQPRSDKTIPSWRTLRTAINESFSPKFLIQLDDQIRSKRAKKVADDIQAGILPL